MVIGLIADIHGNAPAARACFDRLGKDVDAVVFLGDLVGYYPLVDEATALLEERKAFSVLGNHDHALLAGTPVRDNALAEASLALSRRVAGSSTIRFLRGLGNEMRLNLGQQSLLAVHGSPWDPMDEYLDPDADAGWQRFSQLSCDIVLVGHTHRAFSRETGSAWVINPGSCGQPRDGDWRAAFAVLDLTKRDLAFCRQEYQRDEVATASIREGLGDSFIRALGISPSAAPGVV